MGRMSVATIDAPEFINVTSINPLISQCEIKVLYVGANRNKSFIDKNAATAIGRTLPGSPIVGYYKKNKEDFADHGEQIIFDDEGMKINDLTRPYGFVPTDAKVWFQKFIDTDVFGNEIEREYLMTVGFLWTGQYEEAQKVYDSSNGNPQSMKLHEKTLQGNWAQDVKTGVDFFIINDAIIQNLCILGEDVEPCFEGADITQPKLSSNFSKDNNFVTTLFTMMKELNEVLSNKEGGNSMDGLENTTVTEPIMSEVAIQAEEASTVENVIDDTSIQAEENFSAEMDKVNEIVENENQVNTEEFAKTAEDKKDNEEEDKKDVVDNSLQYEKKDDEEEKEDTSNAKEDDKEDEKSKEKYQLLEQEYTELQSKYSALETSYNELLEFKNKIEDEQKDALIAQFCMLSDEDKKDVIENKSKYSLDDIEAKLSIICVRKKVNFDLDSDKHNVDSSVVTYNLNDVQSDSLPAWLKAVEATKNRNH